MSRTVITGASGFIGSHVLALLLERGDRVVATVRPGSASQPGGGDAELVEADVRDPVAIRRAMRGAEHVFHIAGVASLNSPRALAFDVNVGGTTVVLEEALRAEVQRVVYTSSVVAVGPARHGAIADESNVWDAGRYRIPYFDSKLDAELAAMRAYRRGLPLVTVNPTWVMGAGAGDSDSTMLVRRFLRGHIPLYIDGMLNVVGVEDVARGHILADQFGNSGHRYILGNRNLSIGRLFGELGRLSDVEPPSIKLPLALALALASAARWVPGLEDFPTPVEVRAASLNWAFSNAKAKHELGWTTSPQVECLEAAIAWLATNSAMETRRRARLPLRLAGRLFGSPER